MSSTGNPRPRLLTGLVLVTASAAGLTWLAARPAHSAEPDIAVAWKQVADDLELPVDLTHAGDGSGRLFVVEQPGRIRVIDKQGKLLERPFLAIESKVRSGGEMGLLGLAFHPDYQRNGRFFVNYTTQVNDLDGNRKLNTVVAELKVSGDDPNLADAKSERALLTFRQPWGNHNGGGILFGPDGFLYIGTGDGGAANDPLGSGQNTHSLLGKLLRIDVDAEGQAYGIPADNPFATTPRQGRKEIYAWGLRNPWRFSFDKKDPSKLFVADVGQNKWEEVHLVKRGDNCGWNLLEGTHRFREGDTSGMAPPIHEYSHREGLSVTGGFVYRGQALPQLEGIYLLTDYYPGKPFWGLKQAPDGGWQRLSLGNHPYMVSAFGQDAQGELYALDHQGGRVYKLVPPAKKKASKVF